MTEEQIEQDEPKDDQSQQTSVPEVIYQRTEFVDNKNRIVRYIEPVGGSDADNAQRQFWGAISPLFPLEKLIPMPGDLQCREIRFPIEGAVDLQHAFARWDSCARDAVVEHQKKMQERADEMAKQQSKPSITGPDGTPYETR